MPGKAPGCRNVRGWAGCGLLAVWVAVACGQASLREPTSSAAETRRPAGVAVDLPFILPNASASATPDDGLTVLAAPTDPAPVRRVVAAFFDAVVAESPGALERLLERSARIRTAPGTHPDGAFAAWRRRFDRLDYSSLGSRVLYLPSNVEVRAASDGTQRFAGVAPGENEVVVLVPMLETDNRFFGPEIVFLLRRGRDGYKNRRAVRGLSATVRD